MSAQTRFCQTNRSPALSAPRKTHFYRTNRREAHMTAPNTDRNPPSVRQGNAFLRNEPNSPLFSTEVTTMQQIPNAPQRFYRTNRTPRLPDSPTPGLLDSPTPGLLDSRTPGSPPPPPNQLGQPRTRHQNRLIP